MEGNGGIWGLSVSSIGGNLGLDGESGAEICSI